MAIELKQFEARADEKALAAATHILFVLPAGKAGDIPFGKLLENKLKRIQSEYGGLAKSPVSTEMSGGAVASWVVLKDGTNSFERHTLLRKAVMPLLDEKPGHLTIAVYGDKEFRGQVAQDAFYVTAINAAELPVRKKEKSGKKTKPLKTITLYGWKDNTDYSVLRAVILGNTMARQLTMLPPNELTPAIYRGKLEKLAAEQGWKHEEYDVKKLKKMGAGAFVAVAQGSEPEDAAIVHLTYSPKGARKRAALVGKGICFDTGGHNLKPARYMHGMHEDMNGSAVALGILLAASCQQLPIRIDCWLAIAQNHISPKAYKQNDVVTALNGTTIEIVHTDAEGRMVLSDSLTLASRAKPEFIMDFATLTGSMAVAVGDRYSGILGNRPELLCKAVAVGNAVGERVCAFPFDEDYDDDLESTIADVKQCTLDSNADHVLAARFLSKFIEGDVPWLHVDLSSSNRKGGLGAVASDVNGFGVAFGLEMLKQLIG